MYMKPENIFAQIAEAGEEEQFDLLFKSPNCRIDRIVSSGHSSPKGFWYDQENDEFILLIQGEATLEFEDRKVTLKKGDYLHYKKQKRDSRCVCSTRTLFKSLILIIFHFHAVRNKRYIAA